MIDEQTSPAPPRRLRELSHLTALLAERVLSERDAGENIPGAHIHTLLNVAILRDKCEAELPAALIRNIDQVDDARNEDGASGLAWLMGPFQGVKG